MKLFIGFALVMGVVSIGQAGDPPVNRPSLYTLPGPRGITVEEQGTVSTTDLSPAPTAGAAPQAGCWTSSACQPVRQLGTTNDSAPSGFCWARFKTWICFRESCTYPPTHGVFQPHFDPQYTYFPCRERAGCGGCGPAGCAVPYSNPNYGMSPRPSPSTEKPAGPTPKTPIEPPFQSQAVPTSTIGTIVMPGYRMADSESPAVMTRSTTPTAPAATYSIPVPMAGGWQGNPVVQR